MVSFAAKGLYDEAMKMQTSGTHAASKRYEVSKFFVNFIVTNFLSSGCQRIGLHSMCRILLLSLTLLGLLAHYLDIYI